MDEKGKKILAGLESQCARREYCSSDVYAKALKAAGGDSALAGEMLESLKENGFVDDLRYASSFAREKSALTGWGTVKIRQALTVKGMPREIIAAALEDIDSVKADEKLDRLLAAKRRSLEGDPYIRFKLIRYALGRGFEYDAVQNAIERLEGDS